MSATRPIRIGLVGCSKQKATDSQWAREQCWPAAEFYRGDLFRKALAVARAQCDEVFILSAKHGLVALDQELGHYDVSLRTLTPAERAVWGARVAAQLEARFPGAVPLELVCFAGALYADALPVALRKRSRLLRPLRGLGLGAQKHRLVQLLEVPSDA